MRYRPKLECVGESRLARDIRRSAFKRSSRDLLGSQCLLGACASNTSSVFGIAKSADQSARLKAAPDARVIFLSLDVPNSARCLAPEIVLGRARSVVGFSTVRAQNRAVRLRCGVSAGAVDCDGVAVLLEGERVRRDGERVPRTDDGTEAALHLEKGEERGKGVVDVVGRCGATFLCRRGSGGRVRCGV
jgi:hypothetical protein